MKHSEKRKKHACGRRWLLPLGMLALVSRGLTAADVPAVPVHEEPLHVVQHQGEHFMIYTNWIEPGVWTQYHEHRNDLLSVIAADTAGMMQIPGEVPSAREAPGGTVLFFPYSGSDPFVHRVGASGPGPFINIGVDFQDPVVATCEGAVAGWDSPNVQALKTNRRGQPYRVTLPAGVGTALPTRGRALLLVPLAASSLRIDDENWTASVGDFRFYDQSLPTRLDNTGGNAVTLIAFSGC